jgi:hypothetical protein
MSLRDYNLPDPEPVEGAVPAWKAAPAGTCCPNCGALLCEVTLEVTMPQLRGGRGLCVYLGCPACPYASPSVTRSLASGAEA